MILPSIVDVVMVSIRLKLMGCLRTRLGSPCAEIGDEPCCSYFVLHRTHRDRRDGPGITLFCFRL